MENTTLSADESVDLTALQLAEILHRKLGVLEEMAGGPAPRLREELLGACREYVASLRYSRIGITGESDAHQRQAKLICTALFGDLHPPAQFWMTPLGADIAWAIGYPHEEVPVWAAAAVCHLATSVVSTKTTTGTLKRTPEGVREYIRQRPLWRRWACTLEPDESTMVPAAPSHVWQLGTLTRRHVTRPA
jgi:hypothetical protein